MKSSIPTQPRPVSPAESASRLSARWKSFGAFALLAVALPLLAFVVMHLFVFTNYTGDVFHEEGFVTQYSSGIYRYRVLGRELLLLTHEVVRAFVPEAPLSLPRDPQATWPFYCSYLLVNGLFAIATSVAFYTLTFVRKDEPRDIDLAAYLCFLLVSAISYSAVTPYDQMSYFFLAASFLATRNENQWAAHLGLAVVTVLGLLTRETQALFTPAICTTARFGDRRLRRRRLWAGAFHLIVFAVCYLGLRFHYGFEHGLIHSVPSRSWKHFASLLFWPPLFVLAWFFALRKVRDPRIAALFFGLSLPYSLTIAVSGLYAEFRLLVPLILCLLVVYSEIERDRLAAVHSASLSLPSPSSQRPARAA